MGARRVLLVVSAATIVMASLTGCSSEPAASAAAAAASAAPARTTPAAMAPAQGATGAAGAVELGTGTVSDLAADYQRRCYSETKESPECEALRSLLVAELTGALQEIEHIGDQRATELAFGALELVEEPEIVIAAARLLGHFPDTPTLGPKMVPLMLESPYVAVQSMAARVLIANPNPQFADLGRLWVENHGGLRSESAYDEYPDFPAHYASMGFPKYPGAEWFSPADSDRSIGWSTKDDVATVARWFGETLHADSMDIEKWNQVSGQQALVLMKAAMDPAKMTRVQQLTERIMKGDQAAAAEYEKLAKELNEASKVADEAVQKSISAAANVPGAFAAGARWIIAAKNGERISKVVIVFPVPNIQRTGIKLVWDLSDYPSAWPPPK